MTPAHRSTLEWLRTFRTVPFSSRITQDVLLTAGTDDHIVPLEQLFDQTRSLTNAHSVTVSLFTEYEGCVAHCQNGNEALLLAYVRNWLWFHLSERDRYVPPMAAPQREAVA